MEDLDEITDGTDPLDPCENLLDSDDDGLDNYFENTTGYVKYLSLAQERLLTILTTSAAEFIGY